MYPWPRRTLRLRTRFSSEQLAARLGARLRRRSIWQGTWLSNDKTLAGRVDQTSFKCWELRNRRLPVVATGSFTVEGEGTLVSITIRASYAMILILAAGLALGVLDQIGRPRRGGPLLLGAWCLVVMGLTWLIFPSEVARFRPILEEMFEPEEAITEL
jgi:hypothetical protein